MKECNLQRSETQTPCEELTYSDSNMKLTEYLKNGAGATDDAGGITIKGASYPYLMTRCNLNVIKKIRKNLHNDNLEKFEQSCFGPLLKLNELNQLRFQGKLMCQLLLHMDMGLSNKERLVFRVNGSKIEFGPSDFSVITGLCCYGAEPTTPSSSSIHEYIFQSSSDRGLKKVKKAFITASRENEGQGEGTLKLALLYFLYGILLAKHATGNITKLNMRYLHLVDDLDKFNACPWGRVAYEFLAESILSVRRRMDDSKGAVKFFDMHGFTYALQTWAYEVMPSVAAHCASRASTLGYQTPRILLWSATKQKQLSSDHLYKLFTSGDDAHLMLDGTQTSSEKKIKIRMGKSKWTAPLSRRQLKKRKLKRNKDINPHTDPTCLRNHPTHNILLERTKRMRKAIKKLKAEKLESDKAIELYQKKLEDLGPKVDDSAAAAEAEKEEIKSLTDGKSQHEDTMSAEFDAIHDHSVESGSLKRGSRSSAHSGPAAECSESGVAVQDNQGKESDIRESLKVENELRVYQVQITRMKKCLKKKMAGAGCSVGEVPKGKMTGAGCLEGEVKMEVSGYSDGEVKMAGAGYSDGKGLKEKMVGADCSVGEVPKEEMACPSSAARAGAEIIEISSDDDVASSDGDSCSDARMETLIAAIQSKAKRHKMDV